MQLPKRPLPCPGTTARAEGPRQVRPHPEVATRSHPSLVSGYFNPSDASQKQNQVSSGILEMQY